VHVLGADANGDLAALGGGMQVFVGRDQERSGVLVQMHI